jgi:hypothetical protein
MFCSRKCAWPVLNLHEAFYFFHISNVPNSFRLLALVLHPIHNPLLYIYRGSETGNVTFAVGIGSAVTFTDVGTGNETFSDGIEVISGGFPPMSQG